MTSVLGEGGEPFVPFFVALFLFIFLLNQFGIVPLKEFGLPFGGSPTADLNTVVPLALLVFCMIQVAAFRKKGLGISGTSSSRSRRSFPSTFSTRFFVP